MGWEWVEYIRDENKEFGNNGEKGIFSKREGLQSLKGQIC